MFEFTKKPQSAALAFIVAGAIWFIVGTLYGLIAAIHLVAPEFFNNIPWLVFGRARPIHVNTVIYGFVVSTLFGCGLYYLPALLKTSLWSQPLAWFSFFCWNTTVLSGPFTFSFGITQGREYAEYIWIFDVILELGLISLAINAVMTILKRKENILYVSIWYLVGAIMWTIIFYFLGNVMWRPSTGALPGLLDSIFLWFYAHDLPGLLLTPLAVGAAYFVIPRVTQTPLYSHTLSLIGFWTLVALYSHIGGHHLLQTPIPAWLKSITVIDSVLMIIPVFTATINIWLTARQRGGSVLSDPPARWVILGLVWYIIVGIQGSLQSLPSIQRVTHFNNWVIGHAHIAVLGFSGFIAVGAAWHILPLILKKKLYSKKLVNLQFGLVMIGLVGFFIVLTAAGLIQGEAWNNGEVVYKVLPELSVFMGLRAALGVLIIVGAFIGIYNLFMTIKHGEPFEPLPIEETTPL